MKPKIPEVFCTATATSVGGTKSYFITIMDGDEEPIRLEIRWNAQQKSVTADVAVLADYNYPDYDSDEDDDDEQDQERES